MDSIVIKAADLFFSALHLQNERTLDEPHESKSKGFSVTCTDLVTGVNWTKVMTDDQVEAVVACLLSNSGEGTPDQYAIASKAVVGCPVECRPIP